RLLGGVAKLVVDRSPIGSLIFQAPEIEAANTLRLERLRHLNGTLQNFVLLDHGEVCPEAAGLAEFGFGRARPVNLKQRAGDVGYLELVPLENAARFRDF